MLVEVPGVGGVTAAEVAFGAGGAFRAARGAVAAKSLKSFEPDRHEVVGPDIPLDELIAFLDIQAGADGAVPSPFVPTKVVVRLFHAVHTDGHRGESRRAECTHRINRQLSQLSQYNKTHKAMSLAKGYLEKEITRFQRIAGYWSGGIRDVESGRCCLISSNGRSDTDTRSSRAYVQSRYEKIGKLTKWLEHVKRFAA